MTEINKLIHFFKKYKMNHFFGVPDSTLSPLIEKLEGDSFFQINYSSNECEALGSSLGSSLVSKSTSIIFMQNSGLGKIINPFTSLVGPYMYNQQFILLIGMRGDFNNKEDAPQHKQMGEITEKLLKLLGIEFIQLNDPSLIEKASSFHKKKISFAILFPKSTAKKEPDNNQPEELGPSRIKYIEEITSFYNNHLFISTTGYTTRELFSVRRKNGTTTNKDLYNVGAMGCASAMALGILKTNNQSIVLLDGDGASLMQMGTNIHLAQIKNNSFVHIIFNNKTYESTGGQPTSSKSINFKNIAAAMGHDHTFRIESIKELKDILQKKISTNIFIEILIKNRKSPALGRPDINLREQLIFIKKELDETK